MPFKIQSEVILQSFSGLPCSPSLALPSVPHFCPSGASTVFLPYLVSAPWRPVQGVRASPAQAERAARVEVRKALSSPVSLAHAASAPPPLSLGKTNSNKGGTQCKKDGRVPSGGQLCSGAGGSTGPRTQTSGTASSAVLV